MKTLLAIIAITFLGVSAAQAQYLESCPPGYYLSYGQCYPNQPYVAPPTYFGFSFGGDEHRDEHRDRRDNDHHDGGDHHR